MKNVLSLSFIFLGLAVGTHQASAQFPGYGQRALMQPGYAQNGYVQTGSAHHQNYHHDYHHGHHYTPASSQYYSGYSAPIQPYTPNVGLYRGGYGAGQISVPQTNNTYSNNYYGQPAHQHHPWHPGHYLLGHH